MKERPKSGAKPTHSGYSELKKYRERKPDMRRADDRALQAWQSAIVSDLGGPTELDMLQNSLLDRATELLIILRHIAAWIQREGVMLPDGNLQPALKTSYISYSNSFRHCLESIYARAAIKPSRVPTIEDIVNEHNSDN